MGGQWLCGQLSVVAFHRAIDPSPGALASIFSVGLNLPWAQLVECSVPQQNTPESCSLVLDKRLLPCASSRGPSLFLPAIAVLPSSEPQLCSTLSPRHVSQPNRHQAAPLPPHGQSAHNQISRHPLAIQSLQAAVVASRDRDRGLRRCRGRGRIRDLSSLRTTSPSCPTSSPPCPTIHPVQRMALPLKHPPTPCPPSPPN